ncbi:Arylesterase precursor [gamma proteobacterium IMCC2047]|nr:Arylesterase precursor [gamma proteobacterium IMCC2047]
MSHILLVIVCCLLSPLLSAKTVLVVGDSLSAAYNMPVENGWVALLDKRLNQTTGSHDVINASISGDTTSGGLSRLPQALASNQPDIVILALGANDGLRALSLSTLKQNLTEMIELSKAQGSKVLLAGMLLPPNYGPYYTNQFKAVYEELATSHDLPLIPFLLKNIGGVETLIQKDGLHPNAQAQPLILDNVWPYLEPLLKG